MYQDLSGRCIGSLCKQGRYNNICVDNGKYLHYLPSRAAVSNGFQGQAGQQVPEMTDEFVQQVSDRYIELYEHITGLKFQKADTAHLSERIEKNVTGFLATR